MKAEITDMIVLILKGKFLDLVFIIEGSNVNGENIQVHTCKGKCKK